jgi:hypothetical protein
MARSSYLPQWSHQAVLSLGGRFEEAIAAAQKALAISGRHPWSMMMLAQTLGDSTVCVEHLLHVEQMFHGFAKQRILSQGWFQGLSSHGVGMEKRRLRVAKWLGTVPAVGTCTLCGREFKIAMTAMKRVADAQEALRLQFTEHQCKEE